MTSPPGGAKHREKEDSMEYVYTQKAEERAKELGLEPRITGTTAMCGHKPVDGMIAQAWLAKGYIVEKGDKTQ